MLAVVLCLEEDGTFLCLHITMSIDTAIAQVLFMQSLLQKTVSEDILIFWLLQLLNSLDKWVEIEISRRKTNLSI